MTIVYDADAYLRCIGCADADVLNLDIHLLRTLHKRHLMSIPYNSRTPLVGTYSDGREGVALVTIDEDAVFDSSIIGGQGGVCFHLNRLFVRLLVGLGYDASLMAAGTAEGQEYFDTDIDHMFIRVRLDGADWLVDVGYPGPSYIEPLLFTDGVQVQYGSRFRMVQEGAHLVLQRRGRTTRWSVVYRFQVKQRVPADWLELEELLRQKSAAAEPGDGDTILCGRTYEDGQIVVKGRRQLTVRDGRDRIRTLLDEREYHEAIAEILTETRAEPEAPRADTATQSRPR